MTRLILAFSSFFRLLFGARLSPKVVAYLPDGAIPSKTPPAESKSAKPEEDKPAPKPAPKPDKPKVSAASHQRDGALVLLGLLHREARLLDFIHEAIDDYEDADIGAAVRDIHRGLKKVITEHVDLEAVMPGEEDEAVTVQAGFDPGEIRLVGNVAGDPPFKGVMRHHGWRATKIKLPSLAEGIDRNVLAPAEVEIS